MPSPKPLSKEQILAAMSQTLSNKAAARYLHVSYVHYKRWAKNYEATEEGYKNLFEQHLNQAGKGVPKFLKGSKKMPAMVEIIEGRIAASSFEPNKLKYALIEQGYLAEECSSCGFKERRVLDYKMPLLLHFKDKNSNNYSFFLVLTILTCHTVCWLIFVCFKSREWGLLTAVGRRRLP